jgi:hypothetical protein
MRMLGDQQCRRPVGPSPLAPRRARWWDASDVRAHSTLPHWRRRCVPARRSLASGYAHPIHPLHRQEEENTYAMVTTHRRSRRIYAAGSESNREADSNSAAARAGRFGPGPHMSVVVAHALPARCQRSKSGDRCQAPGKASTPSV